MYGESVDYTLQQMMRERALLYISLSCYLLAKVSTKSKICGQCGDGEDPVANPLSCRCDHECTYYDDCCENAVTGQTFAEEPAYNLACIGASPVATFVPLHEEEAYWMTTSCPEQWPMDGGIARNCTEDVSAPPVTDLDTGFVFRNTYCAICNNVSSERTAVWRMKLSCVSTLNIETASVENIVNSCSVCLFEKPFSEESNPRFCFPHVSSCPSNNLASETDYHLIIDQCLEGPRSLVYAETTDSFGSQAVQAIYRNEYCAVCNNVSLEAELQCLDPEDFPITDACQTVDPIKQLLANLGPTSFTVFLDVTGSGTVVIGTGSKSQVQLVTCNSDEVFDPSIGCRKIVCPAGQIFTDHHCQTEHGEESHTNMTAPEMINCTTIALNTSEYTELNNASILYQDQEVEVVGYDAMGQPLICTDLNRTGEAETNVSVVVTKYPLGFIILTYFGCFFSILGSSVILLTYSLFKELRTLPSIILINLAVAFIVSDLFLVVGGSLSAPSTPSCTAVAIILHLFMLARFSWMPIMGFEMCRLFFMSIRLRKDNSKRTKVRLLAVYMLVGWSLPLIITTITIVTNYTTQGLVQYGEMEGEEDASARCWINHSPSLVVAFIVPMGVALLCSMTLFVVAVFLLCKASTTSINSIKNQHGRNIRVIIAAFATSGTTWLFGILAMFNQMWAWYPFILLNSSQALLIALAFLLTKKVLKLYHTRLHCPSCASMPQEPSQQKDSYGKNTPATKKYTISDTDLHLQHTGSEGTMHSTSQEVEEDQHDHETSA